MNSSNAHIGNRRPLNSAYPSAFKLFTSSPFWANQLNRLYFSSVDVDSIVNSYKEKYLKFLINLPNGTSRHFSSCRSNMLIQFSITAGAIQPNGEKMQNTTEKKRKRGASRNPTEAAVTCRPYASSGNVRTSDGVMRNFSNDGFYIETANKFESGTILIVRMINYPPPPTSMTDTERPRTICLAEVKWGKSLADENAIRYGMGLRYID